MVTNYNNEADMDVSAVAWQQHFGLNEVNPEDENQWEEIAQWLQQVAPQFSLPSRRDAKFLESMKRLRSRHMERIATDSVVTAFEQQLQHTYDKKEEKLQNQLRQLNVDKDQLSTSGRFQCRSLANIASLLGLTDVRTSCIQTAIASMTVERMDLEMESDKVKDCRLEITSRTLHAQQTMDAMSHALSSINDLHENVHSHEINNWKSEMALLDRKSEEYRKRAIALQADYKEHSIDKDGLKFSALKDFQQAVESLEQTMEIKQQELKQFLDLPINIKDAATKLRSMYDTLDYLKRQRDDLLQSIADSVR